MKCQILLLFSFSKRSKSAEAFARLNCAALKWANRPILQKHYRPTCTKKDVFSAHFFHLFIWFSLCFALSFWQFSLSFFRLFIVFLFLFAALQQFFAVNGSRIWSYILAFLLHGKSNKIIIFFFSILLYLS